MEIHFLRCLLIVENILEMSLSYWLLYIPNPHMKVMLHLKLDDLQKPLK